MTSTQTDFDAAKAIFEHPPKVVGVTGYDFTFHPKDYPALLELLGREEFERRVCPLDVARERLRERREEYRLDGYAFHLEAEHP